MADDDGADVPAAAVGEAQARLGSKAREMGWEARYSSRRGRAYFVNRKTRQRQWHVPVVDDSSVEVEEKSKSERLRSHPPSPAAPCVRAPPTTTALADGAQVGAAIARHYDSVCVAASAKHARDASPVLYARRLNNWVKEMLLTSTFAALARVHPKRTAAVSVLDLAGGRGGDIGKIARCAHRSGVPLRAYASVDVSPASVQEAAARASKLLDAHVQRCHAICDVGCGVSPLSAIHQMRCVGRGVPPSSAAAGAAGAGVGSVGASAPAGGRRCIRDDEVEGIYAEADPANGSCFADGAFRLVWCAFSLHYFFASMCHLSGALDTAARALCPGGLFVATFIDTNILLRLARDAASREERVPEDARLPVADLAAAGREDPWFEFSGALWRVRMPWRTLLAADEGAVPFTLRYRFWMPARCERDADYVVNGALVEEYLPVDEILIDEAQRRGLRLVFEATNEEVVRSGMRTRIGEELARTMQVFRSARGSGERPREGRPASQAQVHQDDFELASLYKVMAFASCHAMPGTHFRMDTEAETRARARAKAPREPPQPCDALGVAIAHDLGIPGAVALPYSVPDVDAAAERSREEGLMHASSRTHPGLLQSTSAPRGRTPRGRTHHHRADYDGRDDGRKRGRRGRQRSMDLTLA